jgi:hypothetical protein
LSELLPRASEEVSLEPVDGTSSPPYDVISVDPGAFRSGIRQRFDRRHEGLDELLIDHEGGSNPEEL